MANVKSRPKAPKSASTKSKGYGKLKNASTGIKTSRRPAKKGTRLSIDVNKVDGLQSSVDNLEVSKPSNKIGKEVNINLSKKSLVTRSGRIKRKNKDHLRLLDNILKSELMIDDKRSNKISNVNNNDTAITNQNQSKQKNGKAETGVKKINKKYKQNKLFRDKNSDKAPNMKEIQDLSLTWPVFQCHYCDKTFSSKGSLQRHIYTHLNSKRYECAHCPKKFTLEVNLQAHLKKQHADIDTLNDFICQICDTAFPLQENLDTHLEIHITDSNELKCIYCNKKFDHELVLIQHEKSHLISPPYHCTMCDMKYNSRTQLTLHVKGHLKMSQNYVCQYCGKDYRDISSMRRHVHVCHGGQRVQCPICKKKLKGHLSEHMRTHEKKRPHECPECGQRFTQSTQLNVHRRSHTGVRPYPCRICGRRFSHSTALMLHIRRHTGEKPFPCAMCPLYFSQLPHMKAHMRNIHGKENAYKCQKCEKFFKLKVDLENHAKTCTAGDKELSFEEKIQASVEYEEIESVMSLSRMRFLLALLLTMIASEDKLRYLGFNKRLIDDLLVESLEAMGKTPVKDESLSPLKRLKTNIEILLDGTVPKEQMEKFRRENKSTEELLELLTDEKKIF